MTSPGNRAISVPILTYHQITPDPHPAFAKYAVTPDQFDEQLEWIGANGYVPVRLDDVFGDHAVDLPDNPIVLTFDDGFADCIDFAVPILEKHRVPAVFFLVAGLLGRTSCWLIDERGIEYPLMTASNARALLDKGFECGAHSVNHVRLASLASGECLQELRDARAMLQDALGSDVRHMSYPFGSYNAVVRDLAESCGYRSAATVQHGVATTTDDPLTLKRIHVLATDGVLAFTRDLNGHGSPAPMTARSRWRALFERR